MSKCICMVTMLLAAAIVVSFSGMSSAAAASGLRAEKVRRRTAVHRPPRPEPFTNKPNPLDTEQAEKDRIYSVPGQGPLQSANYGGYITIDMEDGGSPVEAYYYFVESENDPVKDPLLMWQTGGPGCSSLVALYAENGPYTFRLHNKLDLNPDRWTTNASVLWVDSPPGVGYSIDPDNRLWTDDKTSLYNYKFLNAFYERFFSFSENLLYLTGESYAGHYVPQLAKRIYDGDNMDLLLNMFGWFLSNPCTGDIGCDNEDPTLEPFLRYNGFLPLNTSLKDTLLTADYDPYDILAPICVPETNVYIAQRFAHRNPLLAALAKKMVGEPELLPSGRHKIKKLPKRTSDVPAPYGPCAVDDVTSFLNRDAVKQAFHAKPDVEFSVCSYTVKYEMNLKGVKEIYQELMNYTDWSILLYNGLSDTVVNFVQTQTIMSNMGRPLKSNVFKAWNIPDLFNPGETQLGGFYLEWDRMSWAGARNAGHQVPMYNPPSAKEMLRSFLELGRPGRLS